METDFRESTWRWASKKTEIFRKDSRKWFWGVDVLGGGLISGLTAWILWDRTSLAGWQAGIFTFLAFIVGGFITYRAIFFVMWLIAPYKQRDEVRELLLAKPTKFPLSNRKDLISAIHDLKDTARETIWQNDVAKSKKQIGVVDDYKEKGLTEYSKAYAKYWETEKRLDCQKDIAGTAFETPISEFKVFVKFHVLGRELPNAPSYGEILEQLDIAVNKVVNSINTLSQ